MLPLHPGLAPKRRFRGRRRYFRRIRREAAAFEPSVEEDAWWDFWHHHADWPGWGNRSARYRREHLKCLIQVFRTIAAHSNAVSGEFQSWLYVCEGDAGQDAVYLHSPNPNSAFPASLGSLAPPPRDLSAFLMAELPGIPLLGGTLTTEEASDDGRVETERAHLYWSPEVGAPLEGGHELVGHKA